MNAKTRHVPLRTCVVCRETSAKKTLLRVVRSAALSAESAAEAGGTGQEVRFDPSGKANGRGAYVCASPDCIEKAVKQKRFERSLGVSAISETLADDLRRAAATVRPAGVNAL